MKKSLLGIVSGSLFFLGCETPNLTYYPAAPYNDYSRSISVAPPRYTHIQEEQVSTPIVIEAPREYNPPPTIESPQYIPEEPEEEAAPTQERQAWKDNSYTSPLNFGNSRSVTRHIQEETRGANFYNPNEARDAQIRAEQIREQAWRQQTQQWNRQLESQGYRRKR